jgi:hypothetical protein
VDHERQPALSVRIKATDSGSPHATRRTLISTFVVVVLDSNEPPYNIRFRNSSSSAVDAAAEWLSAGEVAVAESVTSDACLATIAVSDPDLGQRPTCTVVADDFPTDGTGSTGGTGSDGDHDMMFEVRSAMLCLSGAMAVDFERAQVHRVGIRCTDDGGGGGAAGALATEAYVTVWVRNVNERPSHLSITSTAAGGGTAVPPTIVTTTATTAVPEDVGDHLGSNPKPMTLNVSESTPAGTVLGDVAVHDPDNCDDGLVCFPWQTHHVRFCTAAESSDGGANQHFSLVGGTTLVLSKALNFEEGASHRLALSLCVTDNGSPPLTAVAGLMVRVVDANDAPTSLQLSGDRTISVNAAAGAVVGALSVVDADVSAAVTNRVVLLKVLDLSGTGATAPSAAEALTPPPFAVGPGMLLVVSGSGSDRLTAGSAFELVFAVYDGGVSGDVAPALTAAFVVRVPAENLKPVAVAVVPVAPFAGSPSAPSPPTAGGGTDVTPAAALTVAEDVAAGTKLASVRVDDPNSADSHRCTVTVTRCRPIRSGSCEAASPFEVVADLDSDGSAEPETGTGTSTGTGTRTETGSGAHALALRLRPGGSLDYESTTSYELRVSCVDDGLPPLGATVAVTVSVTDVNEAPGPITVLHGGAGGDGAGQGVVVPENARDSFLVATLIAHDPDDGQSVTFAVTAAAAVDQQQQQQQQEAPLPFEINGLQLLVASRPVTYCVVFGTCLGRVWDVFGTC